jgi:hypothetical protein
MTAQISFGNPVVKTKAQGRYQQGLAVGGKHKQLTVSICASEVLCFMD